MAETEGTNAPIRNSVQIDCPVEDAFQLFTERFAEWWPLATHSLNQDEAESCAIEPWEGGRVFERTRSGEEHEWGTVTRWDPPHRIEFAWHPGTHAAGRQRVEVEFSVNADGTRVTLTHTGWQLAGAPICAMCAGITERFAPFVAKLMMVAA